MIVFYEVATEKRVGAVWLDDHGELACEPSMQSMVDRWLINRRKTAAEFMAEYARWGNGYLESRTLPH
jgi:hypothetical protein